MDYKKESMIKAHLRKTYGVEVKSNERLPETLKTLARDLTAENISQAPHKSLKERIIAERPKTDALVPQRVVKPQIQSEMSL